MHLRNTTLIFALALSLLGAGSCRKDPYSAEKAALARGEDQFMVAQIAYRNEIRQLYNDRKFAELEAKADEVRKSKAVGGNGCWKITDFYSSLACREEEPEEMWQLHEKIHQEWEKQFPQSITACIAHADFLTSYAWRARGTGYANEVTEEGWRLFGDRLAAARTLLDQARDLPVKCPVWWQVQMKVALGQSWKKDEFARLFEEAKAFEPTYFMYDFAQAKFLMPRWYGEPGDWEAAAEKEISRPGGLAEEGYARVISENRGYYDDIFRETKASWRKTQKGFEILGSKYPDSLEILNAYCRLACVAEDKALANKLFAEIGDRVIVYCWGERRRYVQMRNWARD